MTHKLHVADGLTLPAELAGRRTAVFGISGSGKSNTATVIVEQLLGAGEQVVMVDPKGEAWGLLSLASGKPSNLPVIIFGEPNGHIETLVESHGPRLADFVVDTGRSVALSLLGFESDQSERRFVATFLRQLYRRKSRQPRPTRTLVVLDEAHLFVPETVRGDGAELSGAVQRIVRQGRSFGLGTLLIDQRPQDVAKRVITQCDTLVCHQLVHKTDREALREWVRGYDTTGQGEAFLQSLASLDPGDAWVWSPGWLKLFERVHVHRRKTFDSGAAPDGSEAARTVRRADVNLDELRGQLAEVVEKAKADDPKELRRQIAELKKQLAGRPAETVTVERIVEVPVLKNGQLDRTEKVIARGEAVAEQIVGVVSELKRLVSPAFAAKAAPVPPGWVDTKEIRQQFAKPRPPAITRALPPGDGTVSPRQQRFLDAAATLTTLGVEVTRKTVAAWVGVHPRGGSVGEELKALADAGLIDLDRGQIRVTEAGMAAAGEVDPGEAVGRAKAGLTNRQQRFFDLIVAAYPGDTTREAIAEAVGIHPRGGSLGEDLGRLVGRGLVEGGRGRYRARDFLFAGTK